MIFPFFAVKTIIKHPIVHVLHCFTRAIYGDAGDGDEWCFMVIDGKLEWHNGYGMGHLWIIWAKKERPHVAKPGMMVDVTGESWDWTSFSLAMYCNRPFLLGKPMGMNDPWL